MRLLKRKIPVWATLVMMALAVVAAVIASVMIVKEYPSTVMVVEAYDLELWNEAKTELVASFDFGDLSLVGDTGISDSCYIKNSGNTQIWAAWTSTGLPANFALICEYYNPGSSTWVAWTELSYSTGPMDDVGLDPGAFCTYKIRFTLENVNEYSPGSYPFTTVLNGADSSTG